MSQDYYIPLKRFSTSPASSIISPSNVELLFGNVEQLVPIARAFERDLSDMMQDMGGQDGTVPSDYGDLVLHHVGGPLFSSSRHSGN